MVLPFEVPYQGSNSRAQNAKMLGLTVEQLADAETSPTRLSVPCLLLALIVTQLHLSFARPMDFRVALSRNANLILDEIEGSLNDCELRGGAVERCRELADHPDLSHVGKRLLKICA